MQELEDHFSAVAEGYARHRPRYPAELVAVLAGLAPAVDLAWDVATGSGQAAVALARHFDRVIATDASAEQIRKAEAHERVEYRVERAEQSSLAPGSASLVTVAQALHWLDFEAFFAEVRRVCRPGAIFAAWTYGLGRVRVPTDPDAVVRVLARFYLETLGPYWPPERRFVEEGYSSIRLPFERVELPELHMEAEWSLADFFGYLRTWSAVKGFREARGVDPVDELAPQLAPLFGDPAVPRRVEWPLRVLAGRVG